MTRAEPARVVAAHDAVWEAWWAALASVPREQRHQRVTRGRDG